MLRTEDRESIRGGVRKKPVTVCEKACGLRVNISVPN